MVRAMLILLCAALFGVAMGKPQAYMKNGKPTLDIPFLREFRDEEGRFLLGDLTQLNNLLTGLTLEFDVSTLPDIEGIRAETDLGGIPLFATVKVDVAPAPDLKPATCTNLEILGDITLSGFFDTPAVLEAQQGRTCVDSKLIDCDRLVNDQYLLDLGDDRFYNQYTISIDGVDVALFCDLDIDVELTSVATADNDVEFALLDVVTDDWNVPVPESERFFNFTTTNALISQKVLAYSSNFSTRTPSFARPDNCTDTTVGDLTFQGQKLLVIKPVKDQIRTGNAALDAIISLVLVFVTLEEMDLTEDVLDELKGDPELVTGPINDELCGLAVDIAQTIAEFIVDNPLTNVTGDFIIEDPFTDAGEGIPALAVENEINQDVPEEVDLLNLLEPNFFVDLIFPEKNTSTATQVGTPGSSTIGTVISFFLETDNRTEDADPLLLLIADLLGFNLTDRGAIEDLEVLDIIADLSNDTDGDTSLLILNDTLNIEDTIFIDVKIRADSLLLDVEPPVDDVVLADPNVLGRQTIIFPSFRLGDLRLDATFKVDVFVDNRGDPENAFLSTPFTLTLDELINVELEWDNFFSQVAALFALDTAALLSLQFGPLLEEVFDCLFSAFFVTPKVTGATFNADAIRINITGFQDAITYVVVEAINLIVPIYQPVLPQVAEVVVQDLLVNQTLVEDTTCGVADVAGITELYNFSEGIFRTISDLATKELFDELFSFVADDDNQIQVLSEPVTFSFDLPVQNGHQQTLNFELPAFYIDNILPPVLNEIKILFANPEQDLFPQFLENIVDIADSSQPVKFTVDLILNLTEPVIVVPGSVKSPGQVAQNNIIRFALQFENIRALLDIYAHYTRYAIESYPIGDFISISCWESRLNESGGIKELTGILSSNLNPNFNPFVIGICNCQRNRRLDNLIKALVNPDGWPALIKDVNFIVDAVGGAIELRYNEDNFEQTVAEAKASCAGAPAPPPKTAAEQEFEENFDTALTLIGLVFGGLSATTLLACSSRAFKRARGIKRGGHVVITEDDWEAEHEYEGHSIFQSPLTPVLFKFGVPAVLVANTVMFVVGDTGDAAIISIEATALGVDLSFPNFLALSVISSVVKLWEGGAYLLAGALFSLSIFFPYFKLFCLFLSWFAPPKVLPTTSRGRIIWFLDTAGKWSFVEFFFLIFVLITFDIRGTSPFYAYLPEDPILEARLIIEPQISLFTFGLAVVVSLVMGNFCLLFHGRIMAQRRIEWRKEKAQEIEEYRKQGTGISIDEDSLKIAMKDWEFTIIPDHDQPGSRYVFHLTGLSIIFVALFAALTMTLLFLASFLPAIRVEQFGLVAYLIEFSGTPTSYTLSVLRMLELTLAQGISAITFLLAVSLVGTITIIPLIQYMMSLAMFFMPLDLHSARKLAESHHILLTWCCVDVFVFAIAFASLEVGVVSSALSSSVDACKDIGDFMSETLVPLEIVEERDAQASCFAMIAIPEIGGFIGILAVVLFNLAQYYTGHTFHQYIEDRSRIEIDLLNDPNKYDIKKTKPTGWHTILSMLCVIKFSKKRSHIKSQGPSAVQIGGDFHPEGGEHITAANPLFQKNKATERARRKMENEKIQQERAAKYETLHPPEQAA